MAVSCLVGSFASKECVDLFLQRLVMEEVVSLSECVRLLDLGERGGETSFLRYWKSRNSFSLTKSSMRVRISWRIWALSSWFCCNILSCVYISDLSERFTAMFETIKSK